MMNLMQRPDCSPSTLDGALAEAASPITHDRAFPNCTVVDWQNRIEWTISSIDNRLSSYSEVLDGVRQFFELGNDDYGSFSTMVERLHVTIRLPGL